MNIQTVIANLLNTIAGKEELLERSRARLVQRPVPDDVTYFTIKATVEFLEINLTELNKILIDCMAVREADIVRELESKDNTAPKGTHDYV